MKKAKKELKTRNVQIVDTIAKSYQVPSHIDDDDVEDYILKKNIHPFFTECILTEVTESDVDLEAVHNTVDFK